jgi:hypothetical protein
MKFTDLQYVILGYCMWYIIIIASYSYSIVSVTTLQYGTRLGEAT